MRPGIDSSDQIAFGLRFVHPWQLDGLSLLSRFCWLRTELPPGNTYAAPCLLFAGLRCSGRHECNEDSGRLSRWPTEGYAPLSTLTSRQRQTSSHASANIVVEGHECRFVADNYYSGVLYRCMHDAHCRCSNLEAYPKGGLGDLHGHGNACRTCTAANTRAAKAMPAVRAPEYEVS